MESKIYEVYDGETRLASNMDLTTALLFMKTYCEAYYQESINLKLVEMEKGEKAEKLWE